MTVSFLHEGCTLMLNSVLLLVTPLGTTNTTEFTLGWPGPSRQVHFLKMGYHSTFSSGLISSSSSAGGSLSTASDLVNVPGSPINGK